jgi:hypothetical protein
MLRRYFFLVGNLFLGAGAFAQSNTVSTGGNASGTTGSVSYSIGQIDYISSSGSNGNLYQGVQQPYEFYSTSGLSEYSTLIDLSLGPNPTSDVLYIHLNEELSEDLNFVLFDEHGKTVFSRMKLEKDNELDLKELPSAMYQLVISSSQQEIKTYKIIKH